jgi:hypothetical protein
MPVLFAFAIPALFLTVAEVVPQLRRTTDLQGGDGHDGQSGTNRPELHG